MHHMCHRSGGVKMLVELKVILPVLGKTTAGILASRNFGVGHRHRRTGSPQAGVKRVFFAESIGFAQAIVI